MTEGWNFVNACKQVIEYCKPSVDERGIWKCNVLDIMSADTILYDNIITTECDSIITSLRELAKEDVKERLDRTLESINWLPNKEMQYTFFSKVNHTMVGRMIRCNGFVHTATSIIVTEEIFLHCEGCHYRIPVADKRARKCPVCGKTVEKDWFRTVKKSYRDFDLQERYDGLSVSEILKFRMILPDNPESQLINYEDLFGNEHDILGIVRTETIRKEGTVELQSIYIQLIGIKPIRVRQFNAEYVKELIEFRDSLGDEPIKAIADHIGINVFGYDAVKQALLLTVIGCATKSSLPNNKCTQMCSIVISDTAMGKSTLSKSFLNYVDKGRYITANTSGAGLLGGIEKKKTGESIFTQGDLSMANNSAVCLDECDKLPFETQGVLLTVISEGVIQVKKIKKFEMNVHINFIIQGNPKTSHFNPDISYFSQIDMSRPFLDRADFLIVMERPYDINNKDQYTEFMQYLLNDHKIERKFDDGKMKDYLHYVKHFVPNPTFSPEANEQLMHYMNLLNNKIQNLNENQEARPITPRTLVSLQKISMAIGRLLMVSVIDEKIVDMAYDIYMEASVKTLIKSFGTFDRYEINRRVSQRLERPQSKSELRAWLEQHIDKNPDISYVNLLELVTRDFGLPEHWLEEIIMKLKQNGVIWENPKNKETYRTM